jgi:FMN-dependent NADH-azoreductase
MTTALIVTSSANGAASVSNRLAGAFADRLRARDPAIRIVTRDVGGAPLPHLVPETVAGVRADAGTEAEHAARALSDTLIEELAAADIVVIGSPMYNFGISSTLKAWFDHVLRPRVTFRYSESGPEGLMTGKKAVVIESRGGFYSEGPASAFDSQEAHLRTMLGFIGITDVTFVRAERLAFGPEAVEAAVAAAGAALDDFTREALDPALAA